MIECQEAKGDSAQPDVACADGAVVWNLERLKEKAVGNRQSRHIRQDGSRNVSGNRYRQHQAVKAARAAW